MVEYLENHPLLIILAVSGIVLVPFILLVYNKLVRIRLQVRSAWADVEVQLKRRYDLIPNLVETVRGYASHEKDTLERVIKARQQCVDVSGVADKGLAETGLGQALCTVFAVAEAYPQLKADENFRALQTQLTKTESKIAYARRFYNEAVEQYNAEIESFPVMLLAHPLGFSPAAFFGLDSPHETDVPRVTF